MHEPEPTFAVRQFEARLHMRQKVYIQQCYLATSHKLYDFRACRLNAWTSAHIQLQNWSQVCETCRKSRSLWDSGDIFTHPSLRANTNPAQIQTQPRGG